MVDILDWNTFEHKTLPRGPSPYIGIFEWGFLYKEMFITPELLKDIKRDTEPYPSVFYFFFLIFSCITLIFL
jgi:hypothetical protein